MKALALLALTIAPLAQAEIYLVTKNTGGGEIVLTQAKVEQCGDVLRLAYAQLPTGEVFYGCWAYMQDKIHVRYFSGDRRAYDIAGFEVKENK